jgi:hypothetical protein
MFHVKRDFTICKLGEPNKPVVHNAEYTVIVIRGSSIKLACAELKWY